MSKFDKYPFAAAIAALIINVMSSDTPFTPSSQQHIAVMKSCIETQDNINGCWEQYEAPKCSESSNDIFSCAQEMFDKSIDQCSIEVLKKPIARLLEIYNSSSELLCQNETFSAFSEFLCWGDAWTISHDIMAHLVEGFIQQDKCSFMRLQVDNMISSAENEECQPSLHKYADALFKSSPCTAVLPTCSSATKNAQKIEYMITIPFLLIGYLSNT